MCPPPPGGLRGLLLSPSSIHLHPPWLDPADFNTESTTLCGHCLLRCHFPPQFIHSSNFTGHLMQGRLRPEREANRAEPQRQPSQSHGMVTQRVLRESCHVTPKC